MCNIIGIYGYGDDSQITKTSVMVVKQGCMCIVQLKDRLWQRIVEFNACIPYSGVSPSTVLPDTAVQAIVALLPAPPQDRSHNPPPTLGTAIQVCLVSV